MTDPMSPQAPFLARAPLAVIRVTGADRVSYLEDVTSQRLADAEPGSVLGSLHLDPQGAVLAVMDAVVSDDELLLLVPDEVIDHVLTVLGGRTFLLDATFEATDLAVSSVRGLEPTPGVEAAIGAIPPDGRFAPHAGVLVVGRPDGADLVGPEANLDELSTALSGAGVEPADATRLDDWRIRAGLPRWGREVVAGHLPEELGLLPSHVHLGKGCYPGQEAVARMWMLGRPRRRLALVGPDGDVESGWEAGEGRRRVRVTSVTSGGDAALAFVPDGTAAGDRFEGDGAAVEVRRVVGDTLDVPGHDPAVTRRRDRRRADAAG